MKTTKKIILLLFISFFMSNTSADAQEPILGEIKMFGGNFAPRGYAFCDGQLLPINQNQALFAILGTTYGGDGRTTFGLPDLRGRAPIHEGRGPGLSDRRLGSRGGEENHILTIAEMPSHSHAPSIAIAVASAVGRGEGTTQPQNNYIAEGGSYSTSPTENANLAGISATNSNTGGSQAHNNMQPYLTVNYIIALQGLFPSRS